MSKSTDLAARLAASALDHFERAAVQVLTAAPHLIARDDVQAAYIEDDGAVRWTALAAAIQQHLIPASSGERRLVLLACSLASPQVPVALSEALVGLDVTARAAVVSAVATATRHQTAPDGPPTYVVDFAAPVPHSHRPGMVAGLCGHAVAPSEWRAGCRYCERCGPVNSVLVDLLPALRPIVIPAVDGDGQPVTADELAEEVYAQINRAGGAALAVEGDFEVTVTLATGEVAVHDATDEDLVLARGVITGPGVAR